MMKKRYILSAAVLASAIILSCEKEDPTGPINYDPTTPPCSFCPSGMMELNGSGFVEEDFATQVAFHHYGGITVDPMPVARTIDGYYGFSEGMAIEFNFANLPLACVSNKITFAHARFASNSNDNPSLVNVQFPGTPLIVTVPDSLDEYLAPYGYTVEHYFQPGFVYMNTAGDGFVGVVDSVIITGPEFETVRIGANLFESELRSICVSHQ